MNGNTVSLHVDIVTELVDTLKKKGLSTLRNKILLSLPDDTFRYGSNLWWEQSELKATDDIKKGKGIRFNTAEEALRWLDQKK